MTAERKSLWPLGGLSVVLLVMWSVWAVLLWPSWGQLPAAGWVARGVAWGVPCAVYLRLVWKERWWFPLGLTFPLGRDQVVRTVVVFLLVVAFSLVAGARASGTPLLEWLSIFVAHAQPRLAAPVLEELVFRGVVLSELLTWTHAVSKSAVGLRLRFWGSQLGTAGLFLLLHLPHWVTYGGWAWAADRAAPLVLFALVVGFVFAHTRSIWPCIALHYLNNELSLMPIS